MNVEAKIEALDASLRAGDREAFTSAAQVLEAEVSHSPALQAELCRGYANRVHEAPVWAVLSGALIEVGAPPEPLAGVLLDQIRLMVADSRVGPADLQLLVTAATAAWARDLKSRETARQIPGLLNSLARWKAPGSPFEALETILTALDDETLVFWLPDTKEAWRVRVFGVATIGQLSAVAVKSLAEPLAHIASAPDASDSDPNIFPCKFHFFAPSAVDPETGLPAPKRFVWAAPGGRGDGSLPPDFLAKDIPRVGTDRILVVGGSRSGGKVSIIRMLLREPHFCGMVARAELAENLDEAHTARVSEAVLKAARDHVPSEADIEFLSRRLMPLPKQGLSEANLAPWLVAAVVIVIVLIRLMS